MNHKFPAYLMWILTVVLWTVVLWACLTKYPTANSVTQKHVGAILCLTCWMSGVSLYFCQIPGVTSFTRRGLSLLLAILNPALQLFETLPRKLWLTMLSGLWVGYVVLNVILEQRLAARVFVTEGYITAFSFREVFTVANRPVTVPLFYKLLGNRWHLIEVAQYIVSIICWTFLAYAIQHTLKTRLLKLMAWIVILLFSINRELFFWHSMLLSESLSHSLLAAGLGLSIMTVEMIRRNAGDISRRWQLMVIVVLSAWLVVWSQTRDANSYAVLTSGGLLLLFVLWQRIHRKEVRSLPLILALSCFLVFAGQIYHAERGQRWQMSYLNILGDRILTDEQKNTFFAERGLAQNERVLQYAGHRGWDFLPDHDLRYEINDWLNKRGRAVYLEYLLTHPVQSLYAPLENWQQLLDYHYNLAFLGNIDSDADVPGWMKAYSCVVYWDDIATCGVLRAPDPAHHFSVFFPLVMTVNALTLVIIAWWAHGWDIRQFYPAAMLVLMYAMAFVIWHGDADSIERHSVQVNILWRLSLWFAVLFALDWLLNHIAISRSRCG